MKIDKLSNVIKQICRHDSRYAPDAYEFLLEALASAMEEIVEETGFPRHLSGKELAEAIRDYAKYTYGPMTLTMLHEWGVTKTADFGDIVYNLIDAKHLSKEPTDTKADFENVYDFEEVFNKPYMPRA